MYISMPTQLTGFNIFTITIYVVYIIVTIYDIVSTNKKYDGPDKKKLLWIHILTMFFALLMLGLAIYFTIIS